MTRLSHLVPLFAAAAICVSLGQDKKPAPATPETPAAAPKVPSPAGAKVYFISPGDGDTVKGKVLVQFGLKGMGVAPAGIAFPNTGHHHLVIDGAKFDMDLPLPMTDTIKHFGGGQTEAAIELPPGKHTLQLVFGDHLHRPHDPPVMSEVITVTVER